MRAGVVALASTAACLTPRAFPCDSDAQCDTPGRVGHCEPDRLCSFDDGNCESGHRYGDLAGDHSGECTTPEVRPLRNACVAGEAAPTRDDPCAAAVCAEVEACCVSMWTEACVHLADVLCDVRCGEWLAVTGDVDTAILQYVDGWRRFGASDGAADRIAWADARAGVPRLVASTGGAVRGLGVDLASLWGYDVEAGATIQAIAAADADRDGVIDVAVAGIGGESIRLLYLLEVAEPAAEVSALLPQRRPGAFGLAWNDYTGDGAPDLAMASSGNYRLLYYSRADERFEVGFTAGGGAVGEITVYLDAGWGDVDGDGVLDLVMAGTQLRVHLGEGNAIAQVADWTRRPPENSAYVAAVGDLDGDRRADIVAAISPRMIGTEPPAAGAIDARWGWSDGDFEIYQRAAPRLVAIRLADVDGDDRLDVLGAVEGGGAVWLRNVGARGAPALADPEPIDEAAGARWLDPTGWP